MKEQVPAPTVDAPTGSEVVTTGEKSTIDSVRQLTGGRGVHHAETRMDHPSSGLITALFQLEFLWGIGTQIQHVGSWNCTTTSQESTYLITNFDPPSLGLCVPTVRLGEHHRVFFLHSFFFFITTVQCREAVPERWNVVPSNRARDGIGGKPKIAHLGSDKLSPDNLSHPPS